MNDFNFNGGDTLPNGAAVIARMGEHVLAHTGHDYVTWAVDPWGDTFWGNYFPLGGDPTAALLQALKDLRDRAGIREDGDAYATYARHNATVEGHLVFDEEPDVRASDGGAWVAAWYFVEDWKVSE